MTLSFWYELEELKTFSGESLISTLLDTTYGIELPKAVKNTTKSMSDVNKPNYLCAAVKDDKSILIKYKLSKVLLWCNALLKTTSVKKKKSLKTPVVQLFWKLMEERTSAHPARCSSVLGAWEWLCFPVPPSGGSFCSLPPIQQK